MNDDVQVRLMAVEKSISDIKEQQGEMKAYIKVLGAIGGASLAGIVSVITLLVIK